MDGDLDQRLHALRDSADVDALIDLGCDLADAGRHADAEEVFRRAARDGDPVALFDLGNELVAQGRGVEAVQPFERAVAGGETDAWLNLGIALAELGDLAGARRAYEGAAAAGDTKGWVQLGWHLAEIGDREGAEAAMASGARAGDALAAAVLAAWRWESSGDPALEDELRRGAELHPDARASLGRLLRRAGRLEEARAVLERGVELGERESILPLGNLLSDGLGDAGAAERVYRLGIEAGDTYCHNNLGVLLRARGDLAGAAEQFFYGDLQGDALATANLNGMREA